MFDAGRMSCMAPASFTHTPRPGHREPVGTDQTPGEPYVPDGLADEFFATDIAIAQPSP
jgi:hypothetical protein